MKTLLIGATLLLANSAVAQQPQPRDGPPSHPGWSFVTTGEHPQQPPPDANAPPQPALPSPQAQQLIQDKIAHTPELAGTNLKVNVDDNAVMLTGTVDNQEQHDVAVRIADRYAGGRRVEDHIQIRSHT